MPLPIIQTQNSDFAQQLAAYRSSSLMAQQEPEMIQNNTSFEQFRDQAFKDYTRNQIDNAATIGSSIIRRPFLNALGIGKQGFAGGNWSKFSERVGKAGGDILSDMGGYVYQGKGFSQSGKYSDATNAVRWFVPIARDNRIPGKPSLFRGRGRFTAGMRSYLGWNWMLGNPQDMSLGDHAWSLTKHMAVSYGMDYVTNKLLRNPGKILEHLSGFGRQNFLKDLVSSSDMSNVVSSFSPKLRKRIEDFNAPGKKGVTVAGKAARHRRLIRSMSAELNDLPISNKNEIYSVMKKRMQSILTDEEKTPINRVMTLARNMVSESKFSHTRSARAADGILDYFSSARKLPDELAGKGVFGLAKASISSGWGLLTGKASVEKAASNFGALSSRLTRNAFTIGGVALRMANIASGAIGAISLLNEGEKYRNKLRTEYTRNMMSDSMAFSYMPEMGMNGTERTRAVEAIQNSSMGLRNFLGQEGMMSH